MHVATEFLRDMRTLLVDALRPIVSDVPRVVLLDYPDHPNVGDSLIWLGELAALRAAGAPEPSFVATAGGYQKGAVERALQEGVLLLHGGGNFGDLWPMHEEFRERVMRDFPGRPVVLMPQTMAFRDPAALARAQRTIAAHGNVTLLMRTERSAEAAREAFDARVLLVPDAALALEPLPRPAPKSDEVVYLARTDLEAPARGGAALPAWITETDWLEESLSPWGRAIRAVAERPKIWTRVAHIFARDFEQLATERCRRGVRTVARGAGLITDRLHGHVLAILLGLPHCVLDNNYGKVRALWDTWTSRAPNATWCGSVEEAVAHAESWRRA